MNYAVKKRVNSPPRAIDHPKDLKSVYTTSGKGARRSREYNCLVLSWCGSAFGVCELTLALCNAGQQHALPLWGGTCGIAQVVRQDVGKPIASPASFIDSYI